MNCPNCGNASKPGEKFCMSCGYQYPQQAQMPYQQAQMPTGNYGAQPQYQNAAAKPAKSGKKFPVVPVIIGVVALILVVVGVIVGIKIFGNSGSPEKAVDKFCKSIQDGDEDLFNDSMDDDFIGTVNSFIEIADDMGENVLGDSDSLYEEFMSELEDEVGDVEEVTYKIKDQEEVDADDVLDDVFSGADIEDYEDILEYAEDYLDKKTYKALESVVESIKDLKSSIEDADEFYQLEVKITIEGDDDKTSDTMTFFAIKKGGKWGLIPAGLELFDI